MKKPQRGKLIIWCTIILILLAVSAAFAYGKIRSDAAAGQGGSYFDSLNEYDWSNACPAASCRNDNE